MKRILYATLIGVLIFPYQLKAQETGESVEKENQKATTTDKLSYYEQRAREDALYEQSLKVGDLEDEAIFWESQQAYEENLKKRDRKAYRAYMKGKKAAYAEHAAYCEHHSHHSTHFYYYAGHYYDSPAYYHHYYRPYRYPAGMRVHVGTPNLGVRVGGIF